MIRETPAVAATGAEPVLRAFLDDLGLETLRPISRQEFERMAVADVFEDPDERIELLRGVLVRVTPPGPDHAECVDRLAEYLYPRLVGKARVRIQGPYAASEDSEPEPDVAIYPPGDYGTAHPDRALLLVEVSASSLRKDRKVKRAIYAEVGVPECWILNLRDRCLELLREPRDGDYRQTTVLRPEERVSPLAFPELSLRVGDLIP